ncbi:MAG: hypothetical protein AAGB32_05600 [Pseudomonadota bacterium]
MQSVTGLIDRIVDANDTDQDTPQDPALRSSLARIASAPFSLGASGSLVAGAGAFTVVFSELSRFFEELGVDDGYPFYSHGNFANILFGSEDLRVEIKLKQILSGQMIFHRYGLGAEEHQRGKIDFSAEEELYSYLEDLPPDIPFMCLFSRDGLEKLSDGFVEDEDSPLIDEDGDLNRYSVSGFSHGFRLLARFFHSVCDTDATPSQLMERLEGYYYRLAEYAISHPRDFAYKTRLAYGKTEALSLHDVTVQTDLGNLCDTIETIEGDPDEADESEILKKLGEVRLRLIEQEKEKFFRKQKREAEKKKFDLSLRDVCKVILEPRGAGTYAVRRSSNHSVGLLLPQRIDWYRWAQQQAFKDTDGQCFVKASDVQTGDFDMTVTFTSVITRERLSKFTKTNEGFIRIDLPNDRVGTDLNSPDPNAEMHI